MADTAELLSRLEGVRQTAPGRWVAKCPAHEDRSPSLSIRETGDGRTLLQCFAGCDAGAVVSSVGLALRDLFPRGSVSAARGGRPPVPAADILELLREQALLVAIVASDLAKGAQLTDERKSKLIDAAGRIAMCVDPQTLKPMRLPDVN